jgi:hypothetical protein
MLVLEFGFGLSEKKEKKERKEDSKSKLMT